MSDQDEYLKFAKDLALEAGDIMLQYFRSENIGTKWKKDNTPVTTADTKINSLVIKKVKSQFPDHSVWGEEESHNLGSDFTWVCDPVDGTMPFSSGIPISTFSLALVKKGEPLLGIVYHPFLKNILHAIKDSGAYLNDIKIEVNQADSLRSSYINLEIWGSKILENDSKLIPLDGIREALIREGAKPFTLCSMVYSGVLVAEGAFVGSIFGVRKPEDIAALKVIVEEAGGKVTDLQGNEQRYDQPINGALVSNGLLHNQLLEVIQTQMEI